MARKLDKEQQADLTAFVNDLASHAGYETTAEWARDSGYPAPNLSNLRNARGAVDGYNLLRLIRAAAERSGADPVTLAEEQAATPGGSREQIVERLQAVENGMTELASEVRRALLQRQAARGSSAARPKKSQAGPEA